MFCQQNWEDYVFCQVLGQQMQDVSPIHVVPNSDPKIHQQIRCSGCQA